MNGVGLLDSTPNMKKFLKVTESLKVVLTRVDVALGSFELPFKFRQTKGDRMNQVTRSTKATKFREFKPRPVHGVMVARERRAPRREFILS